MAQLRAKQIKLVGQDDLLIGGANGNGAVLTKGTVGQVLKVLTNGTLGYEKATAADTTIAAISGLVANDVQGALAEIHGGLTSTRTSLEGDINEIRTGAGLDEEGAYVQDETTAYIADATSLANADKLIDTKLKAVSDKLDALGTGSITNLQAEVDAIETAVGLTSTGEFDNTGYAASTHADVASAATNTVKAKILAVDAALIAEEGARAAADTAMTGRLDNIDDTLEVIDGELNDLSDALNAEINNRTAADGIHEQHLTALDATVGAKADGTANVYANGNYINAGANAVEEVLDEDGETVITPGQAAVAPDNHTVAIGKLDAALKAEETARGSANVFIQAELDATQAGAGLAVTGAYEADSTTEYLKTATTLKEADKLLDTEIKKLADDLAALGEGSLTEVQAAVDNIEAGLGFDGETGAKPAFTSTNYVDAADTVVAAVDKLDAGVKANADDIIAANNRINALGAAFNYVGVLTGGADAENAFDLSTLPNGGKDAGDYYKVTTGGYFIVDAEGEAEAFRVNVGDGLVFNTTGGVDIIDNTNADVLAGANIAVTGSADTGFTVALDGLVPVANGGTGKAVLADVTSDSEAIVLTGGTGSVVEGFSIDFDPTKVNFSELAQAGAPAAAADGKYLRWNDTTKAIEYVSAAQLGATVRAEEDFSPAAAANLAVTLAHAPSGDVAVFMNGVKLKRAGYSVVGSTVTLNDSANGYPYEDGDTLSVSYSYAG